MTGVNQTLSIALRGISSGLVSPGFCIGSYKNYMYQKSPSVSCSFSQSFFMKGSASQDDFKCRVS